MTSKDSHRLHVWNYNALKEQVLPTCR